jgi:hypothetical protein
MDTKVKIVMQNYLYAVQLTSYIAYSGVCNRLLHILALKRHGESHSFQLFINATVSANTKLFDLKRFINKKGEPSSSLCSKRRVYLIGCL